MYEAITREKRKKKKLLTIGRDPETSFCQLWPVDDGPGYLLFCGCGKTLHREAKSGTSPTRVNGWADWSVRAAKHRRFLNSF